MKEKQSNSRFLVPPLSTEDDVWQNILEKLSAKERQEADRSVSIFFEPFPGSKEIIIKRIDNSDIAFASLSETGLNGDEWAIYYEV